MSVVELKNLSNDDLKKHLASLIDIEDWTDECGKCGYPRLLHKELHQETACSREQEVPNVLKKNWDEYKKRVKPILRALKEEFKKDIEHGILLDVLTKLINSNTENITKLINSNTENMTLMMTTKKSEASSTPVSIDGGMSRISKLTKPAKVPSWTKDMSLETWTAINTEVPEYVKYHDLIKELKKNK